MEDVLTANQAWKSSGTTLDFKDWLIREKNKGTFIKNDTLSSIIDESKMDIGVTTTPPKLADQSKKILGIRKSVLIISAVIIGAAVVYKVYNKNS